MKSISLGGIALMGIAVISLTVLSGENNYKQQAVLEIRSKPIEKLDPHYHEPLDPDGSHSVWTFSEIIEIPEDMWVSAISGKVENAPIETLHHMTLYKRGEDNNICPNTFGHAKEIYSASMNTLKEDVIFQKPFGLFLKKGEEVALEVMVHNPNPPMGPGGNYENVSYNLIFKSDNKKRNQAVEFFRLRLDDTPCDHPLTHEAFSVPANTRDFIKKSQDADKKYSSSSYEFNENGTIIGMGSNFWPLKGGEKIRVLINNSLVNEFVAEKTDPGYKIPHWQGKIPIKAGDKIAIEAVYSNSFDKDIVDASGMLGFYFASEN